MAPSGKSAKGTPAVKRTTMRRKSTVGKQTRKAPQTLVGLRENNRELAVRVEELEQSLQRSQTRNVALQSERISLNEELVLKTSEIVDLQKQLGKERSHVSRLSRCIGIVKGAIDTCSFVRPISPSRQSVVNSPEHCALRVSPVVQEGIVDEPRQSNGKAYEVRAAREELNVPTLSQTPIAHKPTTDIIEEEQEQCRSPFGDSLRSGVTDDSLAERGFSGSSTYSSEGFHTPALPDDANDEQVNEEDEEHGVEEENVCCSEAARASVLVTSPNTSTSAVRVKDSPATSAPSSPVSSEVSEWFRSFSDDILSESSSKEADCAARSQRRRRRSISSYKEPSGKCKLRSGDPFTEGNQHWERPTSAKKPTKKRRQSCYNSFPSLVDKENVADAPDADTDAPAAANKVAAPKKRRRSMSLHKEPSCPGRSVSNDHPMQTSPHMRTPGSAKKQSKKHRDPYGNIFPLLSTNESITDAVVALTASPGFQC
eukprot:scpid62665/ scgid11179/ 